MVEWRFMMNEFFKIYQSNLKPVKLVTKIMTRYTPDSAKGLQDT